MSQQHLKVKHFIVQPDAYRALVQCLARLPYDQVKELMMTVEQNTQAVFYDEPKETPPKDNKAPAD